MLVFFFLSIQNNFGEGGEISGGKSLDTQTYKQLLKMPVLHNLCLLKRRELCSGLL